MERISEDNLLADPVKQFSKWYQAAQDCEAIKRPDAMALATVRSDGYPEVRVVLLKGFDEAGFVFYTNTRSPKGRALAFAPRAEACFYWMPLDRQVRLRGDVRPVRDAEADAYFKTRPRGSRLSAWASDQSASVESRAALEAGMREREREFEGKDVPRPGHWSGYRIFPLFFEFWQERPDRLHDRFRYERRPDGVWKIDRLYP